MGKREIRIVVFFLFIVGFANLQCFERIVIWGHPLYSHTHSYIHHGFYKAFKHLGYEVHWLNNDSDISDLDLSNSLFITEGQEDEFIPKRSDCFYILHNTDSAKYSELDRGQWVTLQVYTDDVLERLTAIEQSPCIHIDEKNRTIYIPWATDLLPYEIDQVKQKCQDIDVKKQVCFVGTIGYEKGSVGKSLEMFFRGAKRKGYQMMINDPWVNPLTAEENMRLIQESLLSPAMQGDWQVNAGYIPCRIFKNISYGRLGITNSYRVWKLFEEKIIYDPDPLRLFEKAQEKLDNFSWEEQFELMDFIRDNHTYINRAELILEFVELMRQ